LNIACLLSPQSLNTKKPKHYAMRKATIIPSIAILTILLLSGCEGPQPVCGNGSCERGETAENCPMDCGQSTFECGNGLCESGENSVSCLADCTTEETLEDRIMELPNVKKAMDENPSSELQIILYEEEMVKAIKTECPEIEELKEYYVVTLYGKHSGEGFEGRYSIGSFIIEKDDFSKQYCRRGDFIEFDFGLTEPECVTVLESSAVGEKINVVFIPDGYPEVQELLFDEEIMKTIDLEGKYGGLLSVEPFKSNKQLFNFYKVSFNKELDCLSESGFAGQTCVPWVEELMSFCESPTIGIVFVADPRPGGIAGVLGGGRKTGDTKFGSLKGANIIRTNGYYHVVPSTTVHEIGHLFGLNDEYDSLGVEEDTTYVKENCDVIGCPKWCSGQPNTSSPCYDDYIGFFNCMKEKKPDGLSIEEYTECGQEFPNLDSDNCDLGLDCEEGTGCYVNCHGWGLFRSTKDGIMRYSTPEHKPEFYSFGLIGERIICEKIQELTHGSGGICSKRLG